MSPATTEAPALHLQDLCLEPRGRRVRRAERPITLAAVEFDLLHALMRRPGQILSSSELADALRSQGRMTREAAVPVHIHHLRRKIGEDLIRTVRGVGYVIRGGDSRW